MYKKEVKLRKNNPGSTSIVLEDCVKLVKLAEFEEYRIKKQLLNQPIRMLGKFVCLHPGKLSELDISRMLIAAWEVEL